MTPARLGDEGSESRPSRAVLCIFYFAFALTGVLTVLPGPLLPILLHRWALNDAQGGFIIGTQFSGNLLASFFSARNLRVGLLLGLGLMSAGMAGLGFLPWPAFTLCTFAYGLGLGLAIPAVNLSVAAQSSARAASLNLLNSVWGMGAISCPLLVFAARRFNCLNCLFVALSMVSALLLGLLLVRKWAPRRTAPNVPGVLLRVWPLPFAAFMFFLYVGAETSIASWIGVYADRLPSSPDLLPASPVACFWGALVLGRAAGARVLSRINDQVMYVSSLSVALPAFGLILAARSHLALDLSATLCGLSLAPVFPLLLAFASDALLSRRNSGWVFACAGVGGALMPWGTGAISAASTLRFALLLPAGATLIMLLLCLRMFRAARLPAAEDRPHPLASL